MTTRKKNVLGELGPNVVVKTRWPKVVKGTHLTVTTYQDGRTVLEWDDEALLREVRAALASVSDKPVKKKAAPKKATAVVEEKPKAKTKAKKVEEPKTKRKTKEKK